MLLDHVRPASRINYDCQWLLIIGSHRLAAASPVVEWQNTQHDLGFKLAMRRLTKRGEQQGPLLFAQVLKPSASNRRVSVAVVGHPADEGQPGRAL